MILDFDKADELRHATLQMTLKDARATEAYEAELERQAQQAVQQEREIADRSISKMIDERLTPRIETLAATIARVNEERAQAREALRKYGRHLDGVCDISVDTSVPTDPRCTCGLRELVEAK